MAAGEKDLTSKKVLCIKYWPHTESILLTLDFVRDVIKEDRGAKTEKTYINLTEQKIPPLRVG